MPRLDELVDPNAFDAQFSGQPLPDETGEQFLERRKKLGDLGALGPERLAQGPRDRAQLNDDAAKVRGDLAQNAQRDAIENQRRTDAAAKEAQRRTDAEAKAAQTAANAAAKAAQAAQLKQMREAGIVLKTDDTGATVPDTHEDGRVKYKADMIGDPYIDEQTGRPVRKYRDEYGSTSTVDLEQNGDLHTDAQTGSRYYKSPSGLRVDLGPDEHWQKREAVKADLDRLKTEEELARVELDQHQLATAPLKEKWKEQEKATKELRDKLEEAEGLEKSMGAMLPDASKESIKRLRAQWEQVKPGYEAAKAELDAATAREREISGGILEKKKRAIEIAADLDKLKARGWGAKADVPRIEDRAKSAVEQAQAELKAAQDEARTFAASSKLATTATAGGMTEEQAAALTESAGAAGKAVNEKIKAAAAKVAHLNKLAGTLAETTAKLESTAKEANARMGAIRQESQIVAADVMLGKLPAEQGRAKLDALDKAMEQARKPVETIEQQRKGAITQIATAFDDPQKWEQSPERGLALAEVERKIAEAQESGTTATEAAFDTLKKAPTDMVEGQPIETQIATLKAELERRNAKTPRPEYTEQIAMLNTALGAKASTEQRRKAADDVVNKLIAQRDGATQKAVFNHGSGVLAGSARIYSEQMKAAQRTWDDPNLNVVSKTLLGLGSSLGANLGAALNLVVGSTEADQIRRAEAKQAQEIIGQLDKDGVKQVLELMPAMEERWKAGGVVSSEDWNKGGATFSIGLGGVDSGSTLAGVEATIRALEAGDKSTMARVSSELAAGQLLFLKTDGITIDEKDPVQVAKRAFLRQKLGETIAKQMPNLAAISSGVGSLAAFFEAGGIGRGTVGGKALGERAATAAGMTIMGTDMSFADNPDAMGAMNRFADIAYKSASLAFSEKLGDAFGERITAAMASSPRALSALNKAGLSKTQALGAAKFAGNAVGMTLGETASDVAQNAMDGKNAFEGLRESLMVNGFIGLGMAAFETATLQRFFGARAAAVASGAGGKPAAGAWQGAMQAHNDARAELDAAEQRADAAAIAIAQDKVKATDAALSAMTSQLANVGDATRRGLSAALGAETAAIFPALEENPVLGDAAAAIGAEVRDSYLPGARGEAAAKIVANDPDFTGSNLGDIVINRAIGAMVARDLAAVAEGRANLTPEKKAALVRLGLIEDLGEFPSAITDSGVALLPSAMRKAILADPGKFGVVATAGSDGRIINGLIAQARDQINTRVTGTTTKQAAAVAAAVQAAANAAPVPQAATKPVFVVVINPDGKEGKDRRTWKIEADNASEAESIGRARAAMLKLGVKAATVKLLKGNSNPSANSQSPKSKSETTPKAKEAPKAAPAKQPTFRVVVEVSGKEGKHTPRTWEIEADTAEEAEKIGRARVAKFKLTVDKVTVTPLSSVDAGGGPQSEGNAFIAPSEPVAGAGSGAISDEDQKLVNDAKWLLKENGLETVSVSFLQRYMGMGHDTAQRIQQILISQGYAAPKTPAIISSPAQTATNENENTTPPVGEVGSGQSAVGSGAVETPETPKETKPEAKPKAEKPKKEKKPKAEASPTQKLRTAIGETIGKVLASGKMAKSFGALGVKINRDAKMPPVKKNADGTISGAWIHAGLEVEGQGNPVYSLDFNVDRAVLLLESRGMSAKEASDYVEASLREELIHFAQYQAIYERWALDGKKGPFMQAIKAQYAALWKELTPEQQKAVRDLHGLSFEPWAMSAEGVRMIVQLSLDGKTTTTLTEKLKALLRDALDVLQRLAGNPAAQSEHLARTVEDVKQMLARLESPAADQGQARAEAQRRGDEAAMARMAALGLVENIEGRIRKGKTDAEIAAALQIKDVEGVAAVRAAMKPVDPAEAQGRGDGEAVGEKFKGDFIGLSDEELSRMPPENLAKALRERGIPTPQYDEIEREFLKKRAAKTNEQAEARYNQRHAAARADFRAYLASKTAKAIANPDGVPDVAAPEKPADVVSKEAFQQSVKETNAQAKGEVAKPESEGVKKARKLFDGLAADTPRATFEQVPLPAERMAAAADAAATLYTEGVRTPEDMVKTLVQIGEDTGRDLRKYARAFWRFFQGVDFNLQENPDWQAVFDGLSGGNTETRAEAQRRGESGKESPGPVNNAETGTQEPLGTESAPSDKPASPEPVGVAGSGFTPAIENAPPGGWTEADRVPMDKEKIQRGDWVEYTDSYGKKQTGRVDSIWKVGRIIPGSGATKPKIGFTMVNAAGDYLSSPSEGSEFYRAQPVKAETRAEAQGRGEDKAITERPSAEMMWTRNLTPVGRAQMLSGAGLNPKRAFVTWNYLTDAERAKLIDWQSNPANVITDERPLVQRTGSAETGDAGQAGEPAGAGAQSGGRMGGEQSGGVAGVGSAGDAGGAGARGDGAGDGGGTAGGGRTRANAGDERGGDLRTVRGSGSDTGVGEAERLRPDIAEDYTLTPDQLPTKFSQAERYKANIAAIKLLRQITEEGRLATEAEKKVLAQYVGWGGLKNAFVAEKADWKDRFNEVKELLTPEEYAAARASIQNAHYTSAPIIGSIWKAFRRFGFTGGKLIEGGSGLGHFWGLMPAEMRGKSSYHGVEMDPITAKIAALIYPKATIQNLPFQDAVLERDHFDASAGNPPFGNNAIFDKNHKEASKYTIHNFFIGKQIELLKEGGVGGWVVSHYFLDALDPSARKWIHEQAEFLGAVRLPNTAFKGNANTEVTTDIVFFRKRFKGEAAPKTADWLDVPKVNGIPMNGYFETHPEMLLGTPSMEGTMHAGREEFTLKELPGTNLDTLLNDAIDKLPKDVFGARVEAETQRMTAPKVEVADGLKVGSFFEKDGKIMRRVRDINGERQAEEYIPANKSREERMRGMIVLRNLLNAIVRAELGDASDAQLKKMRAEMSKRYDEFVKKHGPLNSLGNRQAFNDDTDAARVFALERNYDPGISAEKAKKLGVPARKPSAEKADIFTRRVNVRHEEVTTAATPTDAVWVSLNQRGTVDIPYMAKLTGMSEAKVIEGAGELIYEDPKAGWQYREKYLSGNVREKLAQAKKAAESDPRFERNVQALEKAMPADIAPLDIRANLGAGWIPADVVQTFISEVAGEDAGPSVVYVPELGRWNVTLGTNTVNAATWAVFYTGGGEMAMSFEALVNNVLNSKAIRIYRRVDKDTTVFDPTATTAAEEKATQLRERFRDWLMMDEQRRTRLHRIYNDTMNNFVDPKHTGSHLSLPGLAAGIELRPHQKSVVARTIAERTVFYDHVVGAGKTFAGIASFMEMRRLGLVKKALFAVPNHLTMQWRDDFIKLYPNANVLYATPSDFAKDKRQKLFAKIMTGDYDAVILGHSSLKKLGVAAETEVKMFNEMLEEITAAIEAMRRETKAQAGKKIDSRFISQMEKTRDSVKAKLQKAQDRVGQRDEAVNFEEMGFDGIFVDESHEFKNLFFTTQMTRVAGMGNPNGSARAFDLYTKLRYLRDRYNGQAPTVFASGTPVSNSLVEMFTIQRYLQPDALKQMGLTTLDAWAKTFGDVRSVSEVDPSGTGYRMATRFASFQNVGELSTLYRTIADVITMDDLKSQAKEQGKRFPVPNVKGGKPENVVVERSQDQHAFFGIEKEVLNEDGEPKLDSDGVPIVEYNKGSILDRIANMPKDPKVDNMLKVTNDARKSSLDMRLINPSFPDFAGSKINRSVAEMVRIYKKWNAKKGTQLVFCDLSVPASARGKATKKAKEQATGGVMLINDGREIRVAQGAKRSDIETEKHGAIAVFSVKEVGGWSVYEQTTGKRVARYQKSQKAALETAKQALESTSVEQLKNVLTKDAIPLEVFAQFNDEAAQAEKEAEGDETDELKEDESEDVVSMDELLADSSSFSVYDEIKKKLIEQGVPANEIAFIHDYDTPVAKQKLFKAMNAGEIRILLGSTPKLGAGTNVQNKLVALHHLDAPWRPSDLEQREGRIIRQGNEFFKADPDGFEVEIKRYATAQTYDTRMWQLIEHKATGIIQFRNADRTTRDLEDIDGEAANAADMKAAASGDPLIQKEINLRTEVRKLDSLRRSHFAADFELASQFRRLKNAPQYYADSLNKAKRLKEIADTNPKPEEFSAVAVENGKKKAVSKPSEIEDAFKSAVNENDSRTFLEYRGLSLSLSLRTTENKVFGFHIHARNGRNEWNRIISYDLTENPNISFSGMFTRLDNFLSSGASGVEHYEQVIAQELKTAAELEPKIGQPFPKEQLLIQKRAEHAETLSALKSNKQKRRTPNNPEYITRWMDDGGNSTGLFADLPRDTREGGVFYSQLTRAVEGLPQAVMAVQQARAAIEKGAKKDEIAMSGILTDPLSPMVGKQPGDKVTKAELLGFALERQATVQDVVLGGNRALDADQITQSTIDDLVERLDDLGYSTHWREDEDGRKDFDHVIKRSNYTSHTEADSWGDDEAESLVTQLASAVGQMNGDIFLFGSPAPVGDNRPTHFGQYQLPGADEGSYREMFVTWPESHTAQDGKIARLSKDLDRQVQNSEMEFGDAVEALWEGKKRIKAGWRDGHSQYSDITNPIVRIRRNMRTDAEGRRTYFIEEIQGPGKSEQEKMPSELRKRIYEIGMKRALRDAIDEGADAIGWTTGEQQAERYDLGKHVDSLNYGRDEDTKTWTIQMVKDGEDLGETEVEDAKLEDTVGKEAAKKMRDGVGIPEGESFGTLSGLDLKVGGEGLKRLYDATLPTIARDLAKKFGGAVGKAVIDAGIKRDGDDETMKSRPVSVGQSSYGWSVILEDGTKWGAWSRKEDAESGLSRFQKEYDDRKGSIIHSMPIPDALRGVAKREGFALFADLPRQTAQIEEEREAILNPDDPNPLKGRSGGQDVQDVFAKVFKGRKDLLDRYAPGAADVITDAEIDASRYRGAMREMMDNLIGELDAVFGETKEGKKKRKAFVAELLPRAARLNPVAYDSNDNFVFADFNMRAGSISQKQAENAGVSTGSTWIGRDGEKLIVGEYLEDLKAYQLLRPMSAALQAALYEDFNRRYPETAHYLERFIAPDMQDARITDSRGFELPEFNRHALRKFFGDVSPFGELGNVEGYVPEVSRTRSLAGIAMAAVRNALNKNWKSGAREYKTGDARESGEVRDIFAGFGLRALEAAAERERRDTAEKLLAIAVKDIPPGGVVPDGWIAVNPQNLSHLANAYASAHGLDGKKLMEFTKAVAAGDMAALKTLVGQAWALLKTNKMIKAEVVKELVRPLTDRVIRNKFVALIDSLSKSYIGGLLAHPFSWITNMTSNELFKLMRIAQRALYGGFIKAAGWVSKDMAREPIQLGGKLALMEAWELTKGLLYARKWNQKQIDSVVSPELFEGNTSISGAVRSMTEDQMTAMDFLKQANVPQAILKAVNYSGMDVKAKQAIAYASYMAQAQVAADEAMKKGIRFADKAQRMEWMKNWLTNAPAEVHRRAHATAVAYAMDYENVPWWMDEKSMSPGWRILMRLMFPFVKWPYNMARQMKRFGLDSAIDLAAWTAGRTIGHVPGAIGETMRSWQSSRKASGKKMANSVAHLATFGMMYAAMRALLGAAKDDDEVERLGRSFDQAGNRLGREWDTSNRINITDVPILGTAVAALAKMHGDTGENDYWLRVRNVPYAGPMLAMASTMSWLSGSEDERKTAAQNGAKEDQLAAESGNAWREFVSDFWSEGILLASANAIKGNESKYTAGQPVSATMGQAFIDIVASRIAPVPVLAAIRDTVDPEMRRLNDSKTLEYAPGFIEGVQSRIPGLSDNLPPKGQVKTKLAANAVKDLAKVDHPKAKRIYTNPTTGKTMATYVDPEDKREIPRWRTLLRIAGANVKPVNRAGYKTAVAGKEQAAAYRKAMRVLNDE